jgi:Carboxypeptidase regulatory-like domain
MYRKLGKIIGAAAMTLSLTVSSWAQLNRGAIRGTASDPSGSPVPNASVTITNTDTNIAAPLTTNGSGFYTAQDLVPGKYQVEFRASGFAHLVVNEVLIVAGTTATVDAALKVGDVRQSINVSGQAAVIDTSASNFTSSIGQEVINHIPLVGRDIQTAVQLLPGVTQSIGPSGSTFGFDSQFGGFPDPTHIVGSGISVNGSQGGANAWYLDGNLNATLGPEAAVVNPSPDAVVVLKSGTNSWHGNIYEFNRNSHFNARNPFNRLSSTGQAFLSPRVNFNDFGGTLGGPVIKKRTFFFFSWETSLLHENKPNLYTVPTALEKAGNFSDRPDLGVCPTCQIYDPTSTVGPDDNGLFHRTAFAGNQIPQSRIDPLAAYYVQSYPAPNFADPL